MTSASNLAQDRHQERYRSPSSFPALTEREIRLVKRCGAKRRCAYSGVCFAAPPRFLPVAEFDDATE